jgi:predicted AlkP superfamily phosphohydrolase/phosphomutase
VGIDGATLSVIQPLLDQGRLPRLQELMASGASGVLESERPSRSPALWTTMVTGKNRDDHGITNFHFSVGKGENRQRKLITSNHRRVLALWNIVGAMGRQVGFAGWWASWPAEPVNGWMISDRMTRSRWSEWTDGGRSDYLTFPADLAAELGPLVIDPAQPPMGEIEELVELDAAERAELLAIRRPIYAHWLSVFKFAFCSQRSYERMSLHMLAGGQPDLMGLFLIANDPVSHTFWHFYQPEEFGVVDAERAERLGELIPNMYVHNDRFLGEILSRVDANTVVMVVSDHGFKASGRRPKRRSAEDFDAWYEAEQEFAEETGSVAVGQSGSHAIDGIFIAAGGPIRAGVETRATLYDIAPTTLALLGLPVPEDMEGRVLTEIFDERFLQRFPIRSIPSYEDYLDREMLRVESQSDDEEALEMLRALGYIG